MTVYRFEIEAPEKAVFVWNSETGLLRKTCRGEKGNSCIKPKQQKGILLKNFLDHKELNNLGNPLDGQFQHDIEVRVIYRRLLADLGVSSTNYPLVVKHDRSKGAYCWLAKRLPETDIPGVPSPNGEQIVKPQQPGSDASWVADSAEVRVPPVENRVFSMDQDQLSDVTGENQQGFPSHPGNRERQEKAEAVRIIEAREKRDEEEDDRLTSVVKAQQIIDGGSDNWNEVFKLATHLQRFQEFGYARQLLYILQDETKSGSLDDGHFKSEISQQYAKCTYKDLDLPIEMRLNKALTILKEARLLDGDSDPESLGLAGAIYKRMWANDGNIDHLRSSLEYYLKGYQLSGDPYPGINAAYVMDLLISNGNSSEGTSTYKNRAMEIRQAIIANLGIVDPNSFNWWQLAVLAEAHFGLGQYAEAAEYLKRAENMDVNSWELESAVRQLATLARLHASQEGGFNSQHAAWIALKNFLVSKGIDDGDLNSFFYGRMGLALSGGGFRAAFFHLGVLARLADLDLLRQVEIISCVSGGSIIGTLYQIELIKTLEEKGEKMSREDYIELVRQIQTRFLASVQKGLRSRLFTGIGIFRLSTATHLAGLIDKLIFGIGKKGTDVRPGLDNLLFTSRKDSNFRPLYDNWKRHTKVPYLVINATTLNTGHNWRFNADNMGVPPGSVDGRIDRNPVFPRQGLKSVGFFPLSMAVAASACFPGFFTPLRLKDYYPGFPDVQLIDGGVYDNQGIACLLERNCQRFIISDASAQVDIMATPNNHFFQNALRANEITSGQVRNLQFRHLLNHVEKLKLQRGIAYPHLKLGLPLNRASRDNLSEDLDRAIFGVEVKDGFLTKQNVPRDVLLHLANLRTDLDAFSDMEACLLMMAGYRTMEYECNNSGDSFASNFNVAPSDWTFLQVEGLIQKDLKSRKAVLAHLEVGSYRFTKLLRLSPFAPLVSRCANWFETLNPIVWILLFALILVSGGWFLAMDLAPRIPYLHPFLIGLIIFAAPCLLWVVLSGPVEWITRKWFLNLGSLKRHKRIYNRQNGH